jgi:hypothetical protein
MANETPRSNEPQGDEPYEPPTVTSLGSLEASTRGPAKEITSLDI